MTLRDDARGMEELVLHTFQGLSWVSGKERVPPSNSSRVELECQSAIEQPMECHGQVSFDLISEIDHVLSRKSICHNAVEIFPKHDCTVARGAFDCETLLRARPASFVQQPMARFAPKVVQVPSKADLVLALCAACNSQNSCLRKRGGFQPHSEPAKITRGSSFSRVTSAEPHGGLQIGVGHALAVVSYSDPAVGTGPCKMDIDQRCFRTDRVVNQVCDGCRCRISKTAQRLEHRPGGGRHISWMTHHSNSRRKRTRPGWPSLFKAFASIWRIRSRVTP